MLVIGGAAWLSRAALIHVLLPPGWIDPPTNRWCNPRRVQAWIHQTPYRDATNSLPLSQISADSSTL